MPTPNTSLIAQAAVELETLRQQQEEDELSGSSHSHLRRQFPTACRRLLLSLPGNSRCADCGRSNPDWASVTYGSLYCLNCSGRHRSYGVQTSFVRSVNMDDWTHSQILSVLEGGNGQLEGFMDRHCLGRDSDKAHCRYHTKAARFYKKHLNEHVRLVAEAGAYRGREASRRLHRQRSPPSSSQAPDLKRRPPQRQNSSDGSPRGSMRASSSSLQAIRVQ